MRRANQPRSGRLDLRAVRWVAVAPLLLALVACGGNSTNSVTPTSPAETPASDTASVLATSPVGATTQAATPSQVIDPDRSPAATPAMTTDSVATEVHAVPPTSEGELPGGLRIGTPKSGESAVKDYPTSDEPAVIPTQRSSTFDSNRDGFLTETELIDALRAAYPAYDWPPGYVYDLDVVIAGIEENAKKFPSLFENGAEQSMLGGPYLCAWQLTLRDAIFAGDTERIAESIERLRAELASNPFMVEIRQDEEDAIDKAELGDPGPLQLMIEIGSCTQMPWMSGTPESAMGSSTGMSPTAQSGSVAAVIRRDGILV